MKTIIQILRPAQWLKNLILYFPPFLGGVITQEGMIEKGILPFFAFCCASSSTYIFNDILDRQKDAEHPVKKSRPLASGAVSVANAATIGGGLIISSLILSYNVSFSFFLILVAYIVVSELYSLKLKNLPLIDLFCISAGFLLRLTAGGVTFNIAISEWLFLSVFLLSLFLSTGKRLSEKNLLGAKAINHRKTLVDYPEGFLDGVMYMSGGAVLVTYTLYVISHNILIYTVPLCTFGLLRYIYRVKSGLGGDPTEALIKDLPLITVSFLWALLISIGLYL